MQKYLRCALLGATALVVSSAGAYAADLPMKAPMAAPAYVAPVATWTGFYLGPNIGGGWANVDVGGVSSNLNGVIGGGQLGYNWQTGNFLIGIEGDFQGSSQAVSNTVGADTVDQRLPWFATLRGRVGYVAGPLLFYFTGGGAWANYKLEVTDPGGTTASDNATKTAWTIGGGLEWMFVPKWSAKIEYLYLDTGERSVTLFGNTFTGRARDNIVRVGLNYHF
jgi:outer membrane immunogenic protein